MIFSEITRQCVNYLIIDNSVPELTENFLILVSSPLQEVDFQPSNNVEVFIIDEDRE